MIEEWKEIEGFDGKYLISNSGNIKSVARNARFVSKSSKESIRTVKERILKMFYGGSGAGAGTTCMVAKKLNRKYFGIELNPLYVKMAEKRIELEVGNLF